MNLDCINSAISHHRERAEFLEKLKSDIEKCKSQNELATLRGVTPQNVSLFCIKYQIVFRGEQIKHTREMLRAQLGSVEVTVREAAKIWGVKKYAARQRLKKLGIKPKPARNIPRELVEKAFFDDPKLAIAAKRLGRSQPQALRYAIIYGIPRTDHRRKSDAAK